jgi:hypothetical protein
LFAKQRILANALCFNYFKPLAGLQVAFTEKPIFHRSLQPVERNAVPGLKNAVRNGKSIVKNGLIREISHGKTVDLPYRTRVPLAFGIHSQNGNAPRKHGFTLNESPSSATFHSVPQQCCLRTQIAHHTVDATRLMLNRLIAGG